MPPHHLPGGKPRISTRKNAGTTPYGRALTVRRIDEEGWTADRGPALAFAVGERTVRKWPARCRAEGPAGLRDRLSRARTAAILLGEADWLGILDRVPSPLIRAYRADFSSECSPSSICGETQRVRVRDAGAPAAAHVLSIGVSNINLPAGA